MKKWYHEVSVEWLKARRDVLTATNVAKLLPEYKRSLKANPGTLMPGFAALWAEKHTEVDPDPTSVGPAARGHLMEPFAVGDWNQQMLNHFHHWDDVIIKNGVFGFSPDAMDISQSFDGVELKVSEDGKYLVTTEGVMMQAPSRIMEIKSYDAAHHMKCCITPKDKHDELLQLSMAFKVLPTLEKATLLFYCPGAPISMHEETYTRDDLEGFILTIEAIGKIYEGTAAQCEAIAHGASLHAITTEEEVYDDFLASQAADNNVDIWRLK